MALTFKTPSDIATDFLTFLKNLKPEINTDQQDSDWWVRAQVLGGVLAGVYADQNSISNDAFPQSARHDALANHLQTYFTGALANFQPATPAVGFIAVTGNIGDTLVAGQQAVYLPNGNAYAVAANTTLAATAGLVPVQSVNTGQTQNLLSGALLTLSSPPPGVNPIVAASGNLSDARNMETDSEAAARILSFIQQPPAGGTAADYVRFALAADPSVVSANVLRFPFGFGSVGVVITAGTTDIDDAIDQGIPVVVIPSQTLIDKVAAYIDTQRPITDCVTVIGPSPINVNVTVKVHWSQGTGGTILPGDTVSQATLLQREVMRAIYKTPPGGRLLGPSGYIVLSDIEEQIDVALSSEPFQAGIRNLVSDRQVLPLSATGQNLLILANQVGIPGTITVIDV